ncbi:MAG: endonuclease [Bacteriovoracaceae bacterium]|nr:endonuclease [Bacteriovoracaceae bacterium]
MKYFFLIVLSLSFSSFATVDVDEALKGSLFDQISENQISFSYDEARGKLMNEIHLEKDQQGYFIKDVYCLEKYYPFNGDAPGNRLPNSDKFNTEHTWPQSKFSNKFPSKIQKTDLHHLFPTFSKINSERGNYPFAEVDNQRQVSCAESSSGRALSTGTGIYFEPPQVHKGNVARAMFYFSVRYQIEIDPVQEEYLRMWHREDPIDEAEKLRHEKIFKLQRNRNPFIDDPTLVEKISDF